MQLKLCTEINFAPSVLSKILPTIYEIVLFWISFNTQKTLTSDGMMFWISISV